MKTLFQSLKITLAFCAILFVGYILVLWGFGAVVTPNHGEAEVVTRHGRVVGAANVGQSFSDSTYFWGRPSAVDYNGGGSGGSNKGPTNPTYLADVKARLETFLAAHPYLTAAQVPSELVTASGSGLDPHISPEAAAVQVKRVARMSRINEAKVKELVEQSIENPVIGKKFINVLKLNIAIDENKDN